MAISALTHTRALASPSSPAAGIPVGAVAPDFGLKALDSATGTLGRTVWLGDLVGPKAKSPKRAVLLNFFATWCKPCQAELAFLAQLQREHGASGLQIVAVNFRRERESVDTAMAETHALVSKHSLPFPVLFDRYTTRNQQAYVGSVGTLPCNVIIGSDGRVLARLQGADAHADAIARAVRSALGEGRPWGT